MVRVIGIDPGTRSFDFCGLDDNRVILDRSISTRDIINDPWLMQDVIIKTGADLVVGPSGFGVPLTSIHDIGERELFLMSLIKKEDKRSTLGMRQSIIQMKQSGLPVFFLPGVIHLPTVPDYRKLNKIDMGTADKLCCAALGIYDQSLRLNKNYSKTSFIMLEMGFGYTAAVAVKNGAVVDGIGGSTGNIGFLSMGGMDAELAYLIGGFDKELIFRGGVETITKTPETLMENENALSAYLEGAIKDVLQLTVSVEPEEILVSGRISRVKGLFDELKERLDSVPVRRIEGFNVKNVKEAAQGAALVANGLAGGRYEELIDIMRIKEAKGTSLDYILLPEIENLRKDYGI
ncbi:putative butyrate kinase [Candidatus Methanoperedens nitroreducens]|uniref:Putative butyrate kinase n=1 Tax=Candidatus Methanoperedens nitratireducens TaxID=1392998 RepID=A0A062V7D6_9EURY|nr:DUF1464 family protein [Candidatus Methanoperedens nitroreducens]KCZ71305.1 putative butyrate kinase [Candidatus Methanoperedens nitroreducens]MDJ1423758.1 DUF1464 family protein [Candidatus Methanoperedens sp.]